MSHEFLDEQGRTPFADHFDPGVHLLKVIRGKRLQTYRPMQYETLPGLENYLPPIPSNFHLGEE